MKKTSRIRLAVLGAAILLSSIPGSLAAKERHGAELAVTAKNGEQVGGELVAVKADSLLLFDHRTGKDLSVNLADLSVIRIVRKSKALTGLLVGFVPGAVGGAVLGAHASDGMGGLGAFLGGVTIGAVTGLVGLAAGFGAGIDSVVRYADLPDAERRAFLLRLNRLAREPGVYVPRTAGPAEEKGAPLAPATRDWPRFRLSWMPAYAGGFEGDVIETGVVSFRFTESLPPGEAGPFLSTYYWAEPLRSAFSLGRFSLGYQWSPRIGAEIEFGAAPTETVDHLADLRFTSTVDGLTYSAIFGNSEITRSFSVLGGLTYRVLVPTDLQPHAVELAAAVGPAWLHTTVPPYLSFLGDTQVVDRKVAWTARARISYEYRFGRALSMGAYGEYRWLKAEIPAFGATEDTEFHDIGDPYGSFFFRMTEVTLPARTLDMGGFAVGLRFGFGF